MSEIRLVYQVDGVDRLVAHSQVDEDMSENRAMLKMALECMQFELSRIKDNKIPEISEPNTEKGRHEWIGGVLEVVK